jgi:uncharacterized protein YchJ
MINMPTINNEILETLFTKKTFSTEELNEFLSLEKQSLTDDLRAIIQFCNTNLDDIDDDVSYNTLIYALFLLKENESENQLDLILDILKWDDDVIEYWFSDLFTECFWSFVYHFGINQIDTLTEFLKQDEIETFSKEQVALALLQIYLKNEQTQNSISSIWTNLLEFYNAIPENYESIDLTYLAFFVSYVYNPTDNQKKLIKDLYEKEYIDLTVNGDYDELFEIIEEEKKVLTIFEINDDLIQFEKRNQKKFNSMIFDDFSVMNNNETSFFSDKKTQRNDPCPCGSGLKFKKCCLN